MGALLAGACIGGPLAEPDDLDLGAGIPGEDDLQPADMDNDGVPNAEDNCPATANANQDDLDQDGAGDACDQCPEAFDPEQGDEDGDNVGDACQEPDPPAEEEEEDDGLCPNGDDLC